MNIPLLKQLVEDRYVIAQKHNTADLWIYNYAAKVQYEAAWNEVTLATRGLIMDANYNIVARPFQKFFNLSEHKPEEIPDEPFTAFEKLDGSLGILYWIGDTPYIATRGNFHSIQAEYATKLLHSKYADTFIRLDRNSTYLFEIIYPQNRIVVDYGDTEDLILIARIDNATGRDKPVYSTTGFPLVKSYSDIKDLAQIQNIQDSDREGFVIRFQNGMRVKVKFEEYCRLHRIITGVSNIAIWEYLANDTPMDELLERVPDEFYQWVKDTIADLQSQYRAMEDQAKVYFKDLGDRKENALYYQQYKHPAILFKMLDGGSYSAYIWRQLRPSYCKPFKRDEG